nr:uncharacterized protein LOC124816659 [Hydra vulgaris]
MWNSGFFLLWNHISTFYNSDLEKGLKLVPKLTSDNKNTVFCNESMTCIPSIERNSRKCFKAVWTTRSCWNSRILFNDEFCLILFNFDCLNVKNSAEYITKRMLFLKPYETVDDSRFTWLYNFLLYFKLWKESIDQRKGNFDESSKSKLFISSQTYEGLQITVHSFKEVVKFLLENGVQFVFSERFCQDDLENYFDRQRTIGCRKDNPSIRDFGYNNNTIKLQFSIRPINGNVQSNINNIIDIENNPLPKRKRRSLIQIKSQH